MHMLCMSGWLIVCYLKYIVSFVVYLSVYNFRASVSLFLLLGKVCENESPFLRWQLVLLLSSLLQQLFPHHSENRTQQCPAKDLGGLVPG